MNMLNVLKNYQFNGEYREDAEDDDYTYILDKNIEVNDSLDKVESFLDFASGYGRLTRFLVHKINPENLYISEVIKKTFPTKRLLMNLLLQA